MGVTPRVKPPWELPVFFTVTVSGVVYPDLKLLIWAEVIVNVLVPRYSPRDAACMSICTSAVAYWKFGSFMIAKVGSAVGPASVAFLNSPLAVLLRNNPYSPV